MKYIISALCFFMISCSTVEIYDKKELIESFNQTKKEFISSIVENKKENINKFFIQGFKNSLIINEIKKNDLSNLLIIIPDKSVEIVSSNKIKSLAIINFGTTTKYILIDWNKKDNYWKISNMYEK